MRNILLLDFRLERTYLNGLFPPRAVNGWAWGVFVLKELGLLLITFFVVLFILFSHNKDNSNFQGVVVAQMVNA